VRRLAVHSFENIVIINNKNIPLFFSVRVQLLSY